MMTGRNAIFGIGKPTEMIGSKNQCTHLMRDMAAPSAMPPIVAMHKAGHGAIEREPEIDPQLAADGVGYRCARPRRKTAAA